MASKASGFSSEEVCKILQENRFDNAVVEVFRANKIDGLVLLDISKDDLAVMGISALGDRKKLQQLIRSLKASNTELGPCTSEYRCSTLMRYDEQHESYQCSSDIPSLCDGSSNVSGSDMEDCSLSTGRAMSIGKCAY